MTHTMYLRDLEYRAALGVKPGDPLPRVAGTIAPGTRSSRRKAAKARR